MSAPFAACFCHRCSFKIVDQAYKYCPKCGMDVFRVSSTVESTSNTTELPDLPPSSFTCAPMKRAMSCRILVPRPFFPSNWKTGKIFVLEKYFWTGRLKIFVLEICFCTGRNIFVLEKYFWTGRLKIFVLEICFCTGETFL